MKNKFAFPARIVDVKPDLSALRSATEDGAAAAAGEIFAFTAEISSGVLDAFSTHMAASSLRNYATDAASGVSFQDSHKTSILPLGRSFAGRLIAEDGRTLVEADFFTVEGIAFGGQHSYATTDDFVRAVKAGIVQDVSIGFYGGRYICDICGENYLSWDCEHYAGREYATGNQGEDTIQCTVTIEDARLSEVSAVYDGATPNAAITKFERAVAENRLKPAEIRALAAHYCVETPGNGANYMATERRNAPDAANGGNMTLLDEASAILGIEGDETAVLEALRAQQKENGELVSLAEDGRAYRADLVDEALAEGVRAFGKEFDEPTYRSSFEKADVGFIKRMRDDWKSMGDRNFPSGRQTDEGEEENPQRQTAVSVLPDAAYN